MPEGGQSGITVCDDMVFLSIMKPWTPQHDPDKLKAQQDEILKRKAVILDVIDKEILVKVRSTGRLIKSPLNLINNHAQLNLFDDEYGISPGQACVFYSKDNFGDKVLGGGWISKN